jgi:glucose/arabinose dehydrogenase
MLRGDRRLMVLGAIGLVAVAAAVIAYRAIAVPELRTEVIQDGLEFPWDIGFLPDGRMVVTERQGRIRVFASAEPHAELVQTIAIPDVRAEGEGGTMGLAVDADFVYVCTSLDADGANGPEPWINVVLRYRSAGTSELTFDRVILAEPIVAAIHHDGCALEVDRDGFLWMTMGDGNTAHTGNLAQEPDSLNGKVIRMTPDGGAPNDNPVLPGAAGRSVAWSMGHRNPQGIAFRSDGLVLAPEHGTDRDDEINLIRPGMNYGYACYTGDGVAVPGVEACPTASAFTSPVWASGVPTLATSGAAFLDGEQWDDWDGDLVVSTLKEEDLRRFTVSRDGTRVEMVETLLDGELGRLRSVTIGPDGWLYVSTSNGLDDVVVRVERG